MRKKVLYALACVLYLTGCSSNPSIEEVTDPSKDVIPIQFSIQMEKEVLPFPVTRSMPDNTIPEPSLSKTENSDKELNELCTQIEYVVFTDGATPQFIKHKHFSFNPADSDMDFGIVYDSLKAGNYQFLFLAHNTETATLSGSTFSFDNVSDSFYGSLSKAVSVAEESNGDIELRRIVSSIEFMATDTVHTALKQFDMEANGVSKQLDILTGNGILTVEKQTYSYTFKPDEVGKSSMTHSFYTFLPETINKLSVHLSAIGKNDALIRERQIDNITPERNKVIRYKGRLYSRSESDDTFFISIFENGTWDTPHEEDLPDYDETNN